MPFCFGTLQQGLDWGVKSANDVQMKLWQLFAQGVCQEQRPDFTHSGVSGSSLAWCQIENPLGEGPFMSFLGKYTCDCSNFNWCLGLRGDKKQF